MNGLCGRREMMMLVLTDERGWNPIAALAGYGNIILNLLDLESDPQALSRPFRSHMPRCLFDKARMPQEVATNQSSEGKQQLIAALSDFEMVKNLIFGG